MRKGTAPIHTFTLPFDTEQIAKLRINYAQAGKIVLIKTEQDAEMNGNVVQVKLTQADTLGFSASNVEIHLDILTKQGDPLRSDIYSVYASRCLNEEELV